VTRLLLSVGVSSIVLSLFDLQDQEQEQEEHWFLFVAVLQYIYIHAFILTSSSLRRDRDLSKSCCTPEGRKKIDSINIKHHGCGGRQDRECCRKQERFLLEQWQEVV